MTNNPEFRAGLIPRWLDAHRRARVAQRRAERAEAALARVEALLESWPEEEYGGDHHVTQLREALEPPKPVYDEDQFDGYNEIGAMG